MTAAAPISADRARNKQLGKHATSSLVSGHSLLHAD
jgi:hypothetical protein